MAGTHFKILPSLVKILFWHFDLFSRHSFLSSLSLSRSNVFTSLLSLPTLFHFPRLLRHFLSSSNFLYPSYTTDFGLCFDDGTILPPCPLFLQTGLGTLLGYNYFSPLFRFQHACLSKTLMMLTFLFSPISKEQILPGGCPWLRLSGTPAVKTWPKFGFQNSETGWPSWPTAGLWTWDTQTVTCDRHHGLPWQTCRSLMLHSLPPLYIPLSEILLRDCPLK